MFPQILRSIVARESTGIRFLYNKFYVKFEPYLCYESIFDYITKILIL